MTRDLMQRAFGGSASQLVMRALSAQPTSARELDEIRSFLQTMAEQRDPVPESESRSPRQGGPLMTRIRRRLEPATHSARTGSCLMPAFLAMLIAGAAFTSACEMGADDTAETQLKLGESGHSMFIDENAHVVIIKEYRKHYTSDPGHKETYIAVAILVTNPLSRMLANFFLVFNKSGKPTKLFTDRDKALAWLRPYA